MIKQEMIDELLIKHNVWEAGFTREQLEIYTKAELEDWLESLEG